MRITFFGTGTGVPGPNKKCSCALLEAGNGKYLIDAGCDPMPELIRRGIRPEEITAVFITHRHGDHIYGLVPFLAQCSWHFTKADPAVWLPDQALLAPLRAWITAADGEFRGSLRLFVTREGTFYDDGTLRVTAMKTGHIENAYAYLIEAEGRRVLFSGDLRTGDGPSADYERFTAEGSFDAVICECGHFSAVKYLPAIRKNPPKRFIINHFSALFAETCHHLRKELENEVPVILAEDDTEISL